MSVTPLTQADRDRLADLGLTNDTRPGPEVAALHGDAVVTS
jgi:hypothetical protein